MNQERLSKFYKLAVIFVGGLCLAWTFFNLPKIVFSWDFLLLLVFALLVTPRMSIALPRSKFILSFSDSVIFLAFIFYGGAAAVLLAAIEVAANCFYLRKKGIAFGKMMIFSNVAISVISTAVSFAAWSALTSFLNLDVKFTLTSDLIAALGFLAVVQFFTSSSLVACLSSMITADSSWQIWKRDCFASSMTYIAGASLAFIVYKVIESANFLTTALVVSVMGIVYVNYRRTVKEINKSIAQAEQADREKNAVVEWKAQEVKHHAAELERLLLKEEQINEALMQSKTALEHAAYHDFLTDLPNRTYLVERLNLLIEIGIEISHKYYVLFLDLKRFKSINDRLGHNVGDRILKLVGKRLVRLLRKEDTVARLGGDEFAIILNDLASVEEAEWFAARVYEKLTQPFFISGNTVFSDLHIGIAPFDAEHHKPEDILRDADIAMHHAKDNSVGTAVFDKKLRALYLEKISLEADLRFAIERGELSMHYQPLITLKDGGLMGFEALLRWNHSKKGMIPPTQFIPIAEVSGLIIPITKWILGETCWQIAEWQQLAASYSDLLVSVNISGKHLTDESLVDDVRQALENSNLSPSSLKLEITESATMDNPEQSIQILHNLKKLGVQLSIDDFGTGYSSLSYLHRLPFDALKIDRSFVSEVGERGENSEILQTIVSLAKNLRMRTFAEGIETEAQLAVLQNLGCDYGQGYLMSKPLPTFQMEKLLYQNHNWLSAAETETSASPNDAATSFSSTKSESI
ncbi:MAG: EAL domain-containing protein [Pyrinomonadaceae bacterium]|nr:EAL domain-containing protein [Pyrinomonadaceae bacterium]